jgi:hypothetical protein
MKEIGKNETELKKHLIPRGDWNPSQYEKFLEARKQLLIENFKY